MLRQMPNVATKMSEAMKTFPKLDAESFANSRYYKGGFEPKMTKREASLVLGISPTASKAKVGYRVLNGSSDRVENNLLERFILDQGGS